MFRMRFILKEKGNGVMEYAISIVFRIVFAAIALFILIAIISLASSDPDSETSNAVPIIIFVICAAAALYNESWIFNRGKQTLERRLGLLFIYKRNSYSLDNFERVVITGSKEPAGEKDDEDRPKLLGFGKGIPSGRGFGVLLLEDKDENLLKLDMVKKRHLNEIRFTAKKIAEFCGISLIDETVSMTG